MIGIRRTILLAAAAILILTALTGMRPLHDVHISYCRSELGATELRGRLTLYKDDILKGVAGTQGSGAFARSAGDLRTAILDYVQSHFVVAENGKQVPTTVVRTGADGSTLWIDFRCRLLRPDGTLTIQQTALFHEYRDQMNLVAVKTPTDELNFILTRTNQRAEINRGAGQ